MNSKKKIVIVGGGFAGISLAKKLDLNLFDVIVIDKINHHQFQPLFYQVATSQIEPSSISFPLRYIFSNKKGIRVRLAKVLEVQPSQSKLITSIGDFDYDYLVLAMGCKTNFFGNENIAKNALTLKSTYDAISIRNHFLQTFEDIINSKDQVDESLYNIVVVGAGPTGVELAGAFAEIKKNILPKDYHRIDFSKVKVILIEGSSHTLNNMSENAKINSEKYLRKMGVDFHKDTIVKDYDGNVLTTNQGDVIKTHTVIWSAGVIANTIKGIPDSDRVRGNRIKVNRYNQSVTHPNVFVLGDMAYMETLKYPQGHPQLANVAINQAKNLANNLKKIQKGQSLTEYEYKDLGSMATIGKNKAVVDLPFFKFKGLFAWLVWMFLHLMLILSVRNKLIIFINWAWAYFTKNSALRIILKHSKEESN
jgi:NADH:ubiquinone reductase (H+-translocating)